MVAHILPATRCTAKAKSTGDQCQRFAIRGAVVCPVHGGRAGQVRARAEMRVMEAEARARGGVHEARDPGEALLAACQDADELVQRIKAQLVAGEKLDPGAMFALGEWLDRVGRLSKLTLDARIDERRTAIAERQGELLAGGLRWLFAELGLTGAQQLRIPTLVPEMLRALSEGRAPWVLPGQVEP